ncbi:MAG: hypothetical protein U0793_11255 [Gemmataceae bacterium]
MAKKGESRTESQTINQSETDANGHSTGTGAGASVSNKPIRVFRRRGVKVAVFENHTADGGVFHKAVAQKIYREGDEWRTTTSYSRDDLPIAQLLLGQAWEFILEIEANPNKEDQN